MPRKSPDRRQARHSADSFEAAQPPPLSRGFRPARAQPCSASVLVAHRAYRRCQLPGVGAVKFTSRAPGVRERKAIRLATPPPNKAVIMHGNLSAAAADGGSAHKVATAMTAFQAARQLFVSTVADFLRVQDGGATMAALVDHDLLSVLTCPLVKDPIMGIQIGSLKALGDLAKHNAEVSQEITVCGILDEMVSSLSHQNRQIRAAANTALQSVARHDRSCAQSVVDHGVLEPVRKQLATLDAMVKETAVKTLDVLVEKGPDFADLVADDSTIGTCVSHLYMPEDAAPQSMRTCIALFLANTANHSEPLAQRVVAGEALPAVASLVGARSTKPALRAACLKMLSQVAKHGTELAIMVVEQRVMPAVLHCLTDEDHAHTRLAAASLVQEVSRRTPELAQVVAGDGGCTCLVRNVELAGAGAPALAAILSMGHIAGMHAKVAKQLLDSDASRQLIAALNCPDPGVKGAAGWAVEQIASHGEETAKQLAQDGLLVALEPIYRLTPEGETKTKLKGALKAIIKECRSHSDMEPLVKQDTTADVLRHVLAAFADLLPADVAMRRSFVTSGALMNLQALDLVAGLDARSLTCIQDINAQFPEDVVNYYRPK
eukprot:jgi/Tetstr1/441087/TSEL_029355.t1